MNRDFTMDIVVRADSQMVGGVQAFINFDPTKLEVQDDTPAENGVQIQPGDVLVDIIQENSVDNTTGEINFIVVNVVAPGGSGFPTGEFTLATIRFRGLMKTDSSPTDINFFMARPRQTIVSFGGEDITGLKQGAMVNILEASDMRISFQLQGGARPKPDGWEQPVTIVFDPIDGDPTKMRTVNATSTFDSPNHAFVDVGAVFLGTYDISLVGPSTLTNLKRAGVFS